MHILSDSLIVGGVAFVGIKTQILTDNIIVGGVALVSLRVIDFVSHCCSGRSCIL